MECPEHVPLEHRVEVDQQIAATDEIHLNERGVLSDVMSGEATDFP
jgi:hypothetical protein